MLKLSHLSLERRLIIPMIKMKYIGSVGALLPGKFLRIRKVFAMNILLSVIHGSFWKITEVSGKFLDRLESFQIVLIVSELSGDFWFCLEIFRIV